MRPENYSSLKSASKVSFAKGTDPEGAEIINLTQKRWNPATGEAAADSVSEVKLSDYERDKERLETRKKSVGKESRASFVPYCRDRRA